MAVRHPVLRRPQLLLSQAPQVLFVVLTQKWGCRAEAWHTEGQLHVNQFCPLLCSDLLVFMLDRTVCFPFPDGPTAPVPATLTLLLAPTEVLTCFNNLQ